MSLFGRSGSSATPAGGLTPDQTARKQEVMGQVRQELASAHLQELVNVRTRVKRAGFITGTTTICGSPS